MLQKKIAFIGVKGIPVNFSGVSGIEIRVEKIAECFVNQGFEVYVFVRNWATPKRIKKYNNINLIHLPTLNLKYTDAFIHSLLASVYVCFSNFDIVCYEAIGPAFFCFLPKLFGKKVVTTIHGLDWQRAKWGLTAKLFLKIAEKIALKLSDKIIVVSLFLKKYYKNKGIKTVFIPHGKEVKKKIQPDIIRKKYGLKGGDYFLYLGRFVPEKRIDWLIKAYKQIPYTENQKLLLAGGESHSKNYVKKLYKIAQNKGNIIFTNYVFGKEKQELLGNCRLFVQPSNLEGSSLAVLEAMAYKKPVLTADIPSNRELIGDKRLLFKSNSYSDFYQKFLFLTKNQNIGYNIKKDIPLENWKEVSLKFIRLIR